VPPELSENGEMADRRLTGIGKCLLRNPELHGKYKASSEDLLKKDYAEHTTEQNIRDSPGWI